MQTRNSTSNNNEKDCYNSNDKEPEPLSVSQVLRRHYGRMKVKGTITSLTKLFKMISGNKYYCDKCKKLIEKSLPQPVFSLGRSDKECSYCSELINGDNPEYVNAVIVELQDMDSFNDLERLSVFLFNEDTQNIRVGETIIANGQIHINESGKGKKLFPYFYSESVQYDKNDKVILSPTDIDAIQRFTGKHGSAIINELVKMYDNSIVGNEFIKKGLLLSAVNSYADADNQNNSLRRERINCLLIGEPGMAKSKLLRSITKLVPNSRYESGGPNSSGKSLTAIVSKEDETYVLRLGPLPLSKNALCAIDEFGRTDFEDQAHFLNVMEEGQFTINRYGINATIRSPTTIIATANPTNNSTWKEDNIIDLNEIPALRPVIDRFDLILVSRDTRDENLIRQYAYAKSELESRKVRDYSSYLVKHIEYAKRLNPQISDDAKIILSEFFVRIKSNGFGSKRILDTLFRLSKAFARLKLKIVVEVDDVNDAIEFYNVVLQQFQLAVSIPVNPRDVAFEDCLRILKESKIGITLEELLKKSCANNEYIQRYVTIGYTSHDKVKPLQLRNNRRVRSIYQMLLNHPSIKRVQEKPVVLQWFESKSACDPCDSCDLGITHLEKSFAPNCESQSGRQDMDEKNLAVEMQGHI